MTNHEFHMMQLADSFFPSGMFGLSGGLESLAKSGRIKNKKDIIRFIRQQIKFQLIPCDCVVLLSIMDAARKGDVVSAMEADNRLNSMKLVKEARIASARSGKQFLNCVVKMSGDRFAKKFRSKVEAGKSVGTYPACLAIAANALGISQKSALRMMLYSYCTSIVGSALRLGIISHIEGQVILTQLARDVNSANPQKNSNGLWQMTPLTEIMQMQHEQDDLRMFIT